MKLSIKSSIRVLIRKQGSKPAHITVTDTTIADTVTFVKDALRPHVDPFAEGRVTSVTVSQMGVSESVTFSFKGLEPKEAQLLICDAIVAKPVRSKKIQTA